MSEKKALIVVANEGYQDFEYERPKAMLESAGFTVITAAKELGDAEGTLGGSTEVTIELKDVDVLDYQVVIFVGGPGASELIEDVDAHMIARDADDEDMILGAICIAPLILAHAGVLKDKKATIWKEDKKGIKRLKDSGATYLDENVVIDGQTITACNSENAEEFGVAIVKALEEMNE